MVHWITTHLRNSSTLRRPCTLSDTPPAIYVHQPIITKLLIPSVIVIILFIDCWGSITDSRHDYFRILHLKCGPRMLANFAEREKTIFVPGHFLNLHCHNSYDLKLNLLRVTGMLELESNGNNLKVYTYIFCPPNSIVKVPSDTPIVVTAPYNRRCLVAYLKLKKKNL